MKKIYLISLICVLTCAVSAQNQKNLEYKLTLGVTATSESSSSQDLELDYAGMGWHIMNSLYLGSIHKWKATVGIEKSKSVTDIESRFDLDPASEEIDSKSVESLFFKTGLGSRLLLKYSQVVVIYVEGTINYNALLGRDSDLELRSNNVVYDINNHWDADIGITFQRGRFSMGMTYCRNISSISKSIDDLSKNVVSLDLGYRFL